MLATQIGYAGRAGDYYPAAACSIPSAPLAAVLSGAVLDSVIPQEVKKIHIHIKNLTSTGTPQAYSMLVSGAYSANRVLCCFFYAFANGEVHMGITTTQKNYAGQGKYFSVICRSGYNPHYIDNGAQYSWEQTIPQELELTYEAGRVRIWVDGELRIDRDDVLSGPYAPEWSHTNGPSIYYNPGWKYDLVDFTYETENVSCRFVPMKSADGQNALYEVYTQQVAEI